MRNEAYNIVKSFYTVSCCDLGPKRNIQPKTGEAFKTRPVHAGFTLIEIIIVLFIIGIAAGLVGITIGRDSGGLEARKFTKELSAVLRYARSHAVSEKKSYCFVLDREEEVYQLYAHDKGEEEGVEVISKSIPEDIEIKSSEINEGVDIEFYPQGSSTGGVIEIIRDGKADFYITINKITGSVEVEKVE